MSSTNNGGTVDRVRLNLRVSKSVKRAYEDVVVEKHGRKRPYTGTELERELRFALNDGTVHELYDAIEDLADVFGKAPAKKNNLSAPSDETAVVSYRIAEPVRNGIMSLASNADCSNPGEFIERIMQSYAVGESVEERLIELTDRIKQATEHEFNDELSAIEKRTKAIAAELEDVLSFTIDDFDRAIQAAPKISPSDYTREKYLPLVLDELDATWHPANPKLFTTRDVPPEEDRDPRNKPCLLMDTADKRLAIKTDRFADNSRCYTVSDAVDALPKQPQHKTARKLMREIGETDGFNYVKGSERRSSDADVLMVDRKAVMNSAEHKALQRVVEIDGESADGSTNPTEKMDTDGTQWVKEAAESLPEDIDELQNTTAIITNKIVCATVENHDALSRDEFNRCFEAVTDKQVAQVRQHDEYPASEPASSDAKGGGNTGETTIQQPESGIEDQSTAMNSADKARTDGGQPKES